MAELSHTKSPKEVLGIMLHNDYFSKWLGIEVKEIGLGFCTLQMTIKKEMLNGFHTVHGGIVFSMADSAFAFACNSHGSINVALECSISFTRPTFEGDQLTAIAVEVNKGKTTGIYDITIKNQSDKLVAKFKGVSYNTQQEHQLK